MATEESAKQVAWELALENLVARLRTLGPTDPDTIAALPSLAAAAVTPRGVQVLAKIYARGVIDSEALNLLAHDGIRVSVPVAATVRLGAAIATVLRASAGDTTVGKERLIAAFELLNARVGQVVDPHDLDAAAQRLLQRNEDAS